MSWYKKLKEVSEQIKEFKQESEDDYVVYRGQANYSWFLKPSLYVAQQRSGWTNLEREINEFNIYFDFVTDAKQYVSNGMTSWEVILEMRHFGLPVRLLDWTESLNAALYFAIIDSKISEDLKKRTEDASLYLLCPFILNEKTFGRPTIYNPLKDSFFEFDKAFLDGKISAKFKSKIHNPFAVIVPRRSERIVAQQGIFTVQGYNNKCIDELRSYKKSYKKIRIEKRYFNEIKEYLNISGTNHFSIYPDFQGLAMHLKEYYKIK